MSFVAAALSLGPASVGAQGPAQRCAFICAPSFTFEVAANRSHLGLSPKVRSLSTGAVSKLPGTTNSELLFVVAAPTALPRTSIFTSVQWLPSAHASRNPFTEYTASQIGEPDIRANSLSATFGLSFTAVTAAQARKWGSLSLYAGDLFSTAARPEDGSSYTHKLDVGLNLTATPFAHMAPHGTWLSGVTGFGLLDYIATGLPHAGDEVPRGQRVFVDDAHALSLIVGMGFPIALPAKR